MTRTSGCVLSFALPAILFHAATAHASLVLDQQGASIVSGGWNTNPRVIQSFTPAVDNVAAVSVRVHGSGGPDNDLTINLYNTYSGGVLSGLIASGFKPDAERNLDHLIEWAPVPVVPENLYYLEFILTPQAGEFALTIGGDVSNPYPRGAVLAGGGNLFSGAADARFSTYAIPEPATVSLCLIPVGMFCLQRRKASSISTLQ